MGQQPQQQHVDTTCGSLLRELQNIWDEVGENDSDRDKMLLQLEQECLEVYRRKVDHASQARAQLHQDLANTEAELAALFSALGDPAVSPREKRTGTLREQLATIRPQVEALRQKKEDRAKQFLEVKTQIANICGEIAATPAAGFYLNGGDQDMSLRKLEEYNSQLQVLQQERSDRLHKVLEYMNAAHELCTLLGMDFTQIIADVHPSLVDSNGGQPKSISNDTIAQLAKTIHSLREEKKLRLQKLRDLGVSLIELWNLMDTPLEDQQSFQHVTCNIAVTEEDITLPGSLALGIIDQVNMHPFFLFHWQYSLLLFYEAPLLGHMMC
jgi:protein regulator of cytokinesis 1